jgi:uncharacterized protein with NRDE domain
MCTLIAIHRRISGAPLVVAANRDEYFDRPTEGLKVRSGEAGAVLAPRDLRAGGTWLGLGQNGLFAAVTNRRCLEPDPGRRSRGWIVSEALASSNATAAADRFADLPTAEFNPFNGFVADADSAFALVYQDTPTVARLEPGAHVIGNADPNAADVPKVARVMERARRAAEEPIDVAVGQLAEICREHTGSQASLEDTCVHLGHYGTRSSMLLVLAEAPADRRLLWADGPPCQADYEDFTPLLHELSQSVRYVGGETPTRVAS